MRRGISLAVSLIVMLAMTLPAAAGPPATSTWSFFEFHCELVGDGLAGYAGVFLEEDWTAPDAAIWIEGDPYEDVPDLIVDWESSSANIDGTAVTATYLMVPYEAEGDPIVMTLDGAIGEIVDQGENSDRFRDGNRWVELQEAWVEYDASAVVVLDDTTLEATCWASENTTTETATNPHAYNSSWDDKYLECFGVPGPDDSILHLFAGEWEGEAHMTLMVMAPGTGEEDPPELYGEVALSGLVGDVDATVEMFDPFVEEPVAEAYISMSVAEGETSESILVAQYFKIREKITELLATGIVELDDGRTYELNGMCVGETIEAKEHSNWTAGPKPVGNAPANDPIEGAETLMPGRSDSAQTKAAVLAPEMACSETFTWEEDGEVYTEMWDLPIGKTLWYTTVGTGDSMTVTTKGSNFDTIVGVYELNGGELLPVGCNDDTWNGGVSLQAAVTWESTLGTTYYIQAGGFGYWEDPDPEFTPVPEYGLLKISIR